MGKYEAHARQPERARPVLIYNADHSNNNGFLVLQRKYCNANMSICPVYGGEIETATSYLIPAPGSQCSEPLPLSLNTYILSPQSKVGPEKSCVELRFLLELSLNLNMNTRNTAGCRGVPWCPVAWVVLPGYKQPGVGGGECSSLCVSPASSQHNYQGVLFCV